MGSVTNSTLSPASPRTLHHGLHPVTPGKGEIPIFRITVLKVIDVDEVDKLKIFFSNDFSTIFIPLINYLGDLGMLIVYNLIHQFKSFQISRLAGVTRWASVTEPILAPSLAARGPRVMV